MSEKPWIATVGPREVGRAESREEGSKLADKHEGLAFVTHAVTRERWIRNIEPPRGWRQFIPPFRTAPPRREHAPIEPPHYWWMKD